MNAWICATSRSVYSRAEANSLRLFCTTWEIGFGSGITASFHPFLTLLTLLPLPRKSSSEFSYLTELSQNSSHQSCDCCITEIISVWTSALVHSARLLHVHLLVWGTDMLWQLPLLSSIQEDCPEMIAQSTHFPQIRWQTSDDPVER